MKKDKFILSLLGLYMGGIPSLMATENLQNPKNPPLSKEILDNISSYNQAGGSRLSNVAISQIEQLFEQQGLKTDDEDKTEQHILNTKGIFLVLKQLGVISKKADAREANLALTVKTVDHGFYSDKIYIVSIQKEYLSQDHQNESTYVIKSLKSIPENKEHVIKKRQDYDPRIEIHDLQKVEEFIISQIKSNDEFEIAQTRGIFWYWDGSDANGGLGIKRYLVVLSCASGKEIRKWAEDYTKGDLNDLEWHQIMAALGMALGQIHYTFADSSTRNSLAQGIVDLNTFKTTLHGDLQIGNVFYDKDKNKIIFIDAATMAKTLNDKDKKSPLKDFFSSYVITKYRRFFDNNKESLGWIDDGFEAFVDGYVSIFPEKSKVPLKLAFINKAKAWSKDIVEHMNKPLNNRTPYSGDPLIKEEIGFLMGKKESFYTQGLPNQKLKDLLKTDKMAQR